MGFYCWRKAALVIVDTALLSIAGFVAFGLRHNWEFFNPAAMDAWVYHVAILGSAVFLIPVFGLERSIWRFISLNDYLLAATASLLVITVATLVTLLASRFDSITHAIPAIHFVLATSMMAATRLVYREICRLRRNSCSKSSAANLIELQQRNDVFVLVVGINSLAEAYIQSVSEFASNRVRIVGLIATEDRHVGRLVSARPVLGVAEDIETVVRDLEPHGTVISRIVVTTGIDALSVEARKALLKLESSGRCELQLFAEQLGILEPKKPTSSAQSWEQSAGAIQQDPPLRFSFPMEEMKVIARRSNALSRRCIDAIAALSLLVLLSPVLITTAALVRLFIGSPVAFWQQRPGRGGVPFRLYKFRTMRAPHDETGRLLSDEERTSPVGNFLRRFRLDELPQLFNILVGDMSFVGPRPLLPRDQAPSDCARLLVRPGLTGWAQVVGGRAVSADDKAALDVWYVKNASLLLDLQIAIRTVPMILFGESIHRSTITDVWHELRRDGIVSG